MNRKLVHLFLAGLLLGLVQNNQVVAQEVKRDSLNITLQQAEAQFLKNNLSLIAGQYNIDDAKAQVITARLFDNPQIGFENILYNPERKTFFDMTHDGGQISASVSQLIQTAGKRNKSIRLAKLNVKQAEYSFFDLLRTLKYTLRGDFYKIYYQKESAKVYQQEISALDKTLKVFQQQYSKGNIAEKEVLRIQSQLYSLQTELNALKDGIDDVQSEFKLLIKANANTDINPLIDVQQEAQLVENVPYHQLLDSALTNRYDLKGAQTNVDYSNLNLKLQKAMAVPDVTLSLTYDKQGSFLRNYTGLGVNIPLPLFNRNQGAIKQAKIAVESSKNGLELQQAQVESELDNAYQGAVRLERLDHGFDPKFRDNFTHLIDEVAKNYQKRNISLLEFLDFYDSYKTNALQFNSLKLDRISSLEQLNFVTGTPIFNK